MTEFQQSKGYVIVTTLDSGHDFVYGVFDTEDEARKFGDNLTNYVVHAIHTPVLH